MEAAGWTFTFCRRFRAACIFSTGLKHVFDKFWALYDQAGMNISTKRPRYYASPETRGSALAKERQYTAAGGEVQVPCGGIHEWQKAGQGDWYPDW